MSEYAIRVENLSKLYRIGGPQERYKTLRDAITNAAAAPVQRLRRLGQPAPQNETMWALKDVSFEVKHGEVLGIIGRNGSGKTTLLKVLSRITEPTEGEVRLRGRVGSLLEVGTGFHPELTGRENVYLNGAILGMRKHEIERKFDEIVAFAEVEKFLDTPVKHYSSGMYVRLAFAVAANLEPEILLVDEVLAVGDAAFQKKCLGKMGEVAGEGRTVVFVSHNMGAVQSLCPQAVWLDIGGIAAMGRAGPVVTKYLQFSLSLADVRERVWEDVDTAPGNEVVKVHRACIRPTGEDPTVPITMRSPLMLEFDFRNLVAGARLNLNIALTTDDGVVAFASSPTHDPLTGQPLAAGRYRSTCRIPGDLLNARRYHVSLRVARDNRFTYIHPGILSFDVHDSPERRISYFGKWIGAVRPLLEWQTRALEEDLTDVPLQSSRR